MSAAGIKVGEVTGDFAKSVGPRIVAYNARKLLRAGVRKAMVEIVQRIAGTQIARKLTERALMRLLVPGISIAVSSGASYLFTRSMLKVSNHAMARRGAVMVPLIRLYNASPGLPRELAPKAFIAVMEAPGRLDGWESGQLDALRHTQSALALDDGDIQKLEGWFDRKAHELVEDLPCLGAEAAAALLKYLATAAALGDDARLDDAYAGAITTIGRGAGVEFDRGQIARIRQRLA